MIGEPLSIVAGYLLGSIPTAYIVTRVARGQDIRKLGGGNVGGLNTFREVGLWPAVLVAVGDLGKGAAAVSLAYWVLQLRQPYVALAGLAAVVGHMWMVFLKFTGGKGMGPTFGALAVLLPLYGYWYVFLVFVGVIAAALAATRNVALSMGVGLFFLPLVLWLTTHSVVASLLAVALALLIGIRFLPTARQSWRKNRRAKAFIFDDGRSRSPRA